MDFFPILKRINVENFKWWHKDHQWLHVLISFDCYFRIQLKTNIEIGWVPTLLKSSYWYRWKISAYITHEFSFIVFGSNCNSTKLTFVLFKDIIRLYAFKGIRFHFVGDFYYVEKVLLFCNSVFYFCVIFSQLGSFYTNKISEYRWTKE